MYKQLLLITLIYSTINCQNQKQTVDVVNESAQVMTITATNADGSFNIKQVVPAYTRAYIIAQLLNLKSAENMLIEAILKDSAIDIEEAIKLGADINMEIAGRKSLLFAIAMEKINAIKCLISLGA